MVNVSRASVARGNRWFEEAGMSAFEALAQTLFDGPVKVHDIKVVEGTDPSQGREALATALMASLVRMGLVRNGRLADPFRAPLDDA
jgi:hypothetical protein